MSDELPNINAVLEHYGAPTRDRRSYMTNCPLHPDRTPSCSINTERQLWNCKSCGEAGSGFDLIMKKEGVTFVRARELAATFGIATGNAGGGGGRVRGGRHAGGGKAAARSRDRQGHGSYVPRWRRD